MIGRSFNSTSVAVASTTPQQTIESIHNSATVSSHPVGQNLKRSRAPWRRLRRKEEHVGYYLDSTRKNLRATNEVFPATTTYTQEPTTPTARVPCNYTDDKQFGLTDGANYGGGSPQQTALTSSA